jgi:ABC-type uncharacterized transport system auxiliary subunit
MMTLSRRLFALGALALPGCTALELLSPSGDVRDIYELQPVNMAAQSARSSRRLMVLMPTAPAAITTDRILIKQDPLAVTYLPDAIWSDSVPQMMQSVLIRTLASAGRIGFIGAQGSGPVPDTVLLTRVDAFEVMAQGDGRFEARISMEMTVLRDRDQRVLGTQRFAGAVTLPNDQASTITHAFQQLLDGLLPQAATWVLARAT